MIKDVELKVKMKTLTLKGIQELLQPQRIMEKYQELAPFTWEILHTFAATPNKSRRQRAQNTGMPANSDEGDDDDWDDDPNLASADDEPMKMWDAMQTPEGFARNPVLPIIWHVRQ
jgi:hypothetical protein